MNGQQTLYHRTDVLKDRLTIGFLRQHLTSCTGLLWISLEPRAWFPVCDGNIVQGRMPGLSPLLRQLPEDLPDDLPLLAASIYEHAQWRHFVDAQPASNLPTRCYTWSQTSLEESESLTDLICKTEPVLSWQDRQRFGLTGTQGWPMQLKTKHYFHQGRRLTWCILPEGEENDESS